MTQINKIGVYIVRQKKKITWLKACFLGDVRVIWCKSLGDSHFQTYVMNFVDIVIVYYLHITLHISQAITSCTHCTSYSLLNLVHDSVCEFVLAIQDYMFLDFNAKCVWCLSFEDKLVGKTCFWKIWVEFKCFWKTFKLILMHFIHEILWFEEFLHKITLFFKDLSFLDFRSIEAISRLIEIAIKILVWICLARLVLDQSNLFFDRSNPNLDRSNFEKRLFKRLLLSCVLP